MWKARAQLAATVSIGTLAIVGLHTTSSRFPIDWSDPLEWLARVPIEDAITEVIRIIALGLSYWFVISTILYFLAVASDIPAAIRAVEWATLPAVRGMTRKVAAVTLATSMAAPAAVLLAPPAPDAATNAPTAVADASVELTVPITGDALQPVVRVSDDGVVVPPGYQEPSEPAYQPTVGVPETPPSSARSSQQSTPVDATVDQRQATSHTVVEGDNLWSISENHLITVTGESPSNTALVEYWSRVIDVNGGNLVSGNPDLIYPGEVIELPSVEGTLQ